MRPMLSLATAVMGLSTLCGVVLAKQVPEPRQTPEFALKLYQKLGEEPGNLFFSPISIQSALAMTAEGARGNTQKQMLEVLSLRDLAPFVQTMAQLTDPAAPADENAQPLTLSIVNGLFPQRTYPLREEFTRLIEERYRAQVSEKDYTQPAQARADINMWVEKLTGGLIKDLIPDGVLTPDTRLVLANAIYFKAAWAEQFSEHATQKAPFFVKPDKQVEVPMMQQTERFGHAESDGYHVVSLAYSGGTASMVLVVPKEKDGLAKVEKALDAKRLGEQMDKAQSRKIRLSMPRFKMTHSVGLGETLKSMGMVDAFTDRADFSGMTTADKLAISAVLHQAVVEVDEKGTEAAAATAVVVGVMSAPIEEEPPLEIKLDRPFMFLIVDRRTGAVLFMGRLVDPGT